MEPTVFPTQHILTVLILTTVCYMLLLFAYSSFKKKNAFTVKGEEKDRSRMLIIGMLAVAFIVRIVVSCVVVGHKTDINCFSVWGNNLANRGFSSFYNPQSGMPDYPPGYMYILGLMAKISQFFGHSIYSSGSSFDLVYVAFIKLPSIIADLAAAYMVLKVAEKKLRFAPAFILSSIVAFSPLFIYISSGWGQIDQILTVLVSASILSLNSRKPILGGFFYGLAILMKPQALMIGPLMACAYMIYVFDKDFPNAPDIGFDSVSTKNRSTDTVAIRLLKTVAAVILACTMIIAATVPFSSAEFPWYKIIFQKYLGTATSYKYASVNAYNIYSLFGKNWAPIDDRTFIGLTFGQLGTIFMVLSVLAGGALYIVGRKRNRGALFLAASFTFVCLFTFGHYMHERYLFPMLLLLIFAYLYYGDGRLIGMFFCYSVTTLLNCLCAFYYSQYHQYHLYWDERLVFWCSLANVILFVVFAYICFRIVIQNKLSKDVFRDSDDEIAAPKKNAGAKKKKA